MKFVKSNTLQGVELACFLQSQGLQRRILWVRGIIFLDIVAAVRRMDDNGRWF